MAEALFEDGDPHPIEAYLREATDLAIGSGLLPGGLEEYAEDPNPLRNDSVLALCVKLTVKIIRPLLPLPNPSHLDGVNKELSERLKYLVISSPLLSSSLTAALTPRRASGMRTPSFMPALHVAQPSFAYGQQDAPKELSRTRLVLLAVLPLTLMAGHFSFALFCALAYALFHSIFGTRDKRASLLARPSPLIQTITSVEALIAAGSFWDAVVAEGFNVLDKEDRSIASSPTVADAQIPLRVSLGSTLTTTQHQFDNIRNLFVPLTSSDALTRLSEMYAPPVMKPAMPSAAVRTMSPPDASRRLSYNSMSRSRPPSLRLSLSQESLSHIRGHSTSTIADKRTTWYGGAATLPRSPESRSAKRRSGLSTMFSQPATPESPGDDPFFVDTSSQPSSYNDSPLERSLSTPSRMGLTRRHSARTPTALSPTSQSFGSSTLSEHTYTGLPVRSRRRSLTRNPSPNSSSSRFATIPRSSPPNSAAALRQALEATMASRRYAVAHMLALRFEDEQEEEEDDFVLVPEERDDDSYWEAVRSVVDLLTSAMEDASTRLIEALEEAEHEAVMVAQPSPPLSPHLGLSLEMPEHVVSFAQRLLFPPGLLPSDSGSFAPGPSNLARLAGHMDSIVESMGNIKDHLSELATTIRSYQHEQMDGDESNGARMDGLRSQSLTVYERLRSELGVALRECERSRGPLQNALWPPAPPAAAYDDTPELSGGSASSCDSGFGMAHDSPEMPHPSALLPAPEIELTGFRRDDDASAHLLRDTSAAHLPPMGIEQVFEASTAPAASAQPQLRERSKLNRSERIELAKVRRETDKTKRQSLIAALGFNALEEHNKQAQQEQLEHEQRDTWGPGTEVVQELKDAIWRVGERRRKMGEREPDEHGMSPVLQASLPAISTHSVSSHMSRQSIGSPSSST
ncbi:hypothetical protein BKA62DRAFT_364987 [Auriculariales sp. MPI-PUGE-AT-0066]|nr:hypothetical protein BKA62DRAFT_364987 [Auriculariales sp. MPI-PUGE-AT-0066]